MNFGIIHIGDSMEKRVDRNKELYEVVNEKIRQRALKTANKEFKETHNKLKDINPGLFGGEEVVTTTDDKPNNKKKIIITAVIFAIIFIFIVLVAVVISNGN